MSRLSELLRSSMKPSVSNKFYVNCNIERLSVLSLLFHDLFVEVKKKSEDELSKFKIQIRLCVTDDSYLEATFGAEAGKLLFD